MEPQYKADQLRATLVEAKMESPKIAYSLPLYPEHSRF